MILNRIGTALKNQDWFVVVLEIFIVVIGIYIGLQVDDWQKQRQDRVEEARYLERLQADTEFNVTVMADLMGEHAGVAKILYSFTQAAQKKTDDFPTGEGVFDAFCRFFINRQAGLRMATINELISTGRLSLIRDHELRETLQLIQAETVRSNRDDSRLSDWVSETARGLRPYITWYTGDIRVHTGLEFDIGADCTVDMKTMALNQDIVSEIVKIYRTESILANIYSEQMTYWQGLREMLETANSGSNK